MLDPVTQLCVRFVDLFRPRPKLPDLFFRIVGSAISRRRGLLQFIHAGQDLRLNTFGLRGQGVAQFLKASIGMLDPVTQLCVRLVDLACSLVKQRASVLHSIRQLGHRRAATILQPARPAVFNFRFSADQDFKDKFERLVEVLGVENAQKRMAAILEKALDIALEKKDPKKKLERRKKG